MFNKKPVRKYKNIYKFKLLNWYINNSTQSKVEFFYINNLSNENKNKLLNLKHKIQIRIRHDLYKNLLLFSCIQSHIPHSSPLTMNIINLLFLCTPEMDFHSFHRINDNY